MSELIQACLLSFQEILKSAPGKRIHPLLFLDQTSTLKGVGVG